MFTRNGLQYTFHHMGIPTRETRPDERYNAKFCMYTSDSNCGLIRVQWHRFEAGSSLDPIIQSVPHAAFKVSDLRKALEGHRVLLGPYEPIEGFRVAIIEDGGIPVELIERALSDHEIWRSARSRSDLT